jgi:two-component system KDP operon response regulator KdpE
MTQGARILVVDDEPQIRRSLQLSLEAHGYTVVQAASGTQALNDCHSPPPDVILLDLLMPGLDGIETTRRLRERSSVPIIILSAVSAEAKKIQALELGADDYVTKPFSTAELLARIKSVLRRAAGARSAEPIFTTGELSVNFATREVHLAGEPVRLTPTEYDLLKYMIENAGRVLTHHMLLGAVWGEAGADQGHYLRVFVGHLRKKLEKNPARPRYILTDPGVGYRFVIAHDEHSDRA